MNGRLWTPKEIERLTELYPEHPTSCIAQIVHRPIRAVYVKAKELGIAKSKEAIRQYFREKPTSPGFAAHQFRKGQTPANKGTRRPGWAPGRTGETQFKKGQRSGVAKNNWRPVGTIMPDTQGYLHIKVREHQDAPGWNPKVWPMYNRWLWEQHKGPIPPKHLVAFKDRDRAHCVIENLELISIAENARRNQMWNALPRELAEVIQLQGVLKRKIRRLNGKEQDRRSA